MDLEKFGKLTLNLLIIWFLLIAGLGLIISFKNGVFF